MTFDVCMVTYNSAKWIPACVRALAKAEYDLKCINLYFADNSSTDDTILVLERQKEMYADRFGLFEILRQPENGGFGKGSNAAARAGKGDFVFFYNIDTEIFPDAFLKLEAAIRKASSQTAAFELRQFPYEHPKYYDPVTLETSWISGACFVLKRSVFEETGGFDESIFMYGEDVDLSWHIRALGYRLQYVPAAITWHYAYQKPGEEKPLQLAGSIAGNLLLRCKYGNGRDIRQWQNLYEQIKPRIEASPEIVTAFHSQLKRVRRNRKQYREFWRDTVCPSAFCPSFLKFDYEFARGGAFYASHLPKKTPEFTVIVRTYRRPELLRMTLESLCHQTYEKFQVLVVEDGVDPGAEYVVNAFRNRLNIRYLPVNAALGRCMVGNLGLEAAQTDYVCFLDDDDYFFAEHLEVMACLIEEQPGCGLFVTGSVEARCKTDPENAEKFHYLSKRNSSGKLHLVDFFSGNPIPIQAAVFRRELFEQYGGFDESLDALEDWDLWMRYLTHASFAFAEKATSIYKVPADNESFVERDRFIGKYRKQVFEKMASYQGLISAQDIYGLFWQPDSKPIVNADEEVLLEEKEMEVLRDTVREIQRSTTWRITFPIRVIPHLLRLVTGFAGRIFLILLSILGKLFNKVAKGVCKGMEGIDTFCDWIGPSTPNPETAEKIVLQRFIQRSRNSLSWRLFHKETKDDFKTE